MTCQALRVLMSSIIDYAGVYPPASLPMSRAVERYAAHRQSSEAWMLARFVCPASRLGELSRAAAPLMPGTFATSGYREQVGQPPWTISMVCDGELQHDLERAMAFNEHHSQEDHGLALVDAVELRARSARSVEDALADIPDRFTAFFEIDPGGELHEIIASLRGTGACAKIRTGGVTADMIPACELIASFLAACHAADVPFKATAGLHHPIRARYDLTYDPGSVVALMHGFLNVFMAAALVRCDLIDEAGAVAVLLEESIENFSFNDEWAGWHDRRIDTMRLARVRESFALSYGSCSFDEPVDDLRRLGLL